MIWLNICLDETAGQSERALHRLDLEKVQYSLRPDDARNLHEGEAAEPAIQDVIDPEGLTATGPWQ